ncbi:MAG: hypothetical protein WBC33_04005, partial [Conexibacter sp.]
DRLELTAADGWPEPLRAALERTLAQAIARWHGSEHDEDVGEVVDADVVQAAPAHADDGARLVELAGPSSELVLGADRLPLPRARRPVRRARVWLRALRRLGWTALLLGLLLLGFMGLRPRTPEHEVIPSSVAGRWPRDAEEAIANLSKRVRFGALSVPADEGDVLLIRRRVRIDVGADTTGTITVTLGLSRGRSDAIDLDWRIKVLPAITLGGGGGLVDGLTLRQRLRSVPGSTRLLDVDGAVLRPLPDLRIGRALWVDGLRPGRVYFVETRLQVRTTPASTHGQFGSVGADCRVPGVADPNADYPSGAVVTCSMPLWNLGPRALRRVRVRFVPYRGIGPRRLVHQIALNGSLSAPDADPPEVPAWGAIVNVDHWSVWRAEYVAGSARIRGADGVVPVRGDPLTGGVVVTDVPAVSDIQSANVPRLEFKLRPVDALAPGARTRS